MKTLCLFLVIASLTTCQRKADNQPMTQQQIDERLIEINAQMTEREKLRIEHYIKEQDWDMAETGTGLRYWIYEDVEGDLGKVGQTAEVSFAVTLLDGTPCYQTE